MKKYRVIRDLQGGDFGMGRDWTAKEWLECMLNWRDSDDSWGDYGDGDNEYLDTREGCKQFWESIIAEGKEQELIDYIAEVWQLDFAEVKPIKIIQTGEPEKIKVHRKSRSKVYWLKFRYNDEEEYKEAYAVVYDSGEVGGGETIQYALDSAHEDGDWTGLDALLTKMFGFTDGEICFYHDTYGAEEMYLREDLEKNFDIQIDNINIEEESKV